MGTAYQYECPRCEYSAVVAGDREVGMVAVVRTMVCASCKALVDVVVGFVGHDGPIGDSEYDRDLNVCPECRSTDVHTWPCSTPCPRCGISMGIKPGGETVHFD